MPAFARLAMVLSVKLRILTENELHLFVLLDGFQTLKFPGFEDRLYAAVADTGRAEDGEAHGFEICFRACVHTHTLRMEVGQIQS